jgi:hypothetical protein
LLLNLIHLLLVVLCIVYYVLQNYVFIFYV